MENMEALKIISCAYNVKHYDMNKRTFYKERKINNRCFDFLSKQNIVVPLILDIYDSDNEAVLQRKTKSQKCLKIKAKI